MINITREQITQKFKFDMMREFPFYGDVILKLPFLEDRSIPTACTDGYTIKYNPDFMRNLSGKQANFVLLHEVFHVILQHNIRGIGKNHDAWNVACDLVINTEIFKLMQSDYKSYRDYFERPTEGLFSDDVMASDTAENLYAKIMEENAKCQQGIPYMKGELINVPGTRRNVHGVYSVPVNPDMLEPSEEAKKLIPGMIREALFSEKVCSNGGSYYVPGEVKSLLVKSAVDWKSILKEYLTEETDGESSYITPERKYIHMDLILPGHSKEPGEIGTVWVFIDSSGSINSDEITRFLSEARILCKDFGATLNICYWDTSVTDVYTNVDKEKDVAKCLPHHSGGTNINCVYQWLIEKKERPGCIIVLTDGYFGTLNVTNPVKKHLRNTILVLSNKEKMLDPQMKSFGKCTYINE